jgi:hypothetical protein
MLPGCQSRCVPSGQITRTGVRCPAVSAWKRRRSQAVEQARALGLLAPSSHRRNAGRRVIGLAPGQIPAAAPSTARPAHQATVPAMSSHAAGFPKLSAQPMPKRAPTTRAGSSRLT